jgi:hypothetical protein
MSIAEKNRIQAQNRTPKSPEKLLISSGKILIIDQFMLANSQFTLKLGASGSENTKLVANYGGLILSLGEGEFEVHRDPQLGLMAVVAHNPESESEGFELDDLNFEKQETEALGKVYVDTRCIVFSDASLLSDKFNLTEFKKLRDCGKEKEARDFLRSLGAAVRYGFNRYGDELAVGKLKDKAAVILWPDVVD